MRMLRKNTVPLKYALQIAEIPEFEYYEDEDGNKYPVGIIPNGKTEVVYSEPQNFLASISTSSEEAQAVEYGLSTADFEAIAIYPNGAVPLVEGALIWHKSEPQYKHIDVEIDDVVLNGDYPIATSADYRVTRVSESINFTKAILKSVNK